MFVYMYTWHLSLDNNVGLSHIAPDTSFLIDKILLNTTGYEDDVDAPCLDNTGAPHTPSLRFHE